MSQLPAIKFFNTRSRSLEIFTPLSPGEVSIYCCGPTVYNYQHIGNLRTYIFEDILVRVLRFAGLKVKHVMNITDVGHLVSDSDQGEDKMLIASKREGKSSSEIAQFYTKVFFEHCAELNILKPDIVCKATDHIDQMISLIKRLHEQGIAYLSGGNVYFDVAKFPAYGELARLNLEQLKAGARIEVDSNKKHPLDFALWFTKSKFENQELQWDSPWGRGYPGWHIECSAMSMHYLGESFDIHCGGIDHISVHHTNELAQSEGATGKRLSNFWMHGAFLLTDKSDKMSKSTGEFLTLDAVKQKSFNPLAYRFFCLQANYRQELNWSWEALEGAQNSLDRLKRSVLQWRSSVGEQFKESETYSAEAEQYLERFSTAIYQDLGLPRAIAVVFELIGDSALDVGERLQLILKFDEVLGLGMHSWQNVAVTIPPQVKQLLEEREKARIAKNWPEADRLRDEILSAGFVIKDSKDGPQVEPK